MEWLLSGLVVEIMLLAGLLLAVGGLIGVVVAGWCGGENKPRCPGLTTAGNRETGRKLSRQINAVLSCFRI